MIKLPKFPFLRPTRTPPNKPRPDRTEETGANLSYAQCGEDLIVSFLLDCLGCTQEPGRYIDIGAHHPTYLNNTYVFYKRGWSGINIDPLAENIAHFRNLRPNDRNLCIGIGHATEKRNFYTIEPKTLSTFNQNTAELYIAMGHEITAVTAVEFLSVDDLVRIYAIENDIDILSIDIEGGELEVIQDLLSNGVRPKVIICETLSYSKELNKTKKQQDVIAGIVSLDYTLYSDTFVNSIFISKEVWETASSRSST